MPKPIRYELHEPARLVAADARRKTRSTILAKRHFLHIAGAAVAVPLFGQIVWAPRYPARPVRVFRSRPQVLLMC
jgi:hypothetical protein